MEPGMSQGSFMNSLISQGKLRSRVMFVAWAAALGSFMVLHYGVRTIFPALDLDAASSTEPPSVARAAITNPNPNGSPNSRTGPTSFDAPKTIPQSKHHALLANFIAQRYYLARDDALSLVRIAHHAAAKRSLDPVLLIAMMAVESSFNPEAVSSMGAKGLMQIIPEYHPDKFPDPETVFDPETNIFAGARILKEYLRQSGDLDNALQRYAGASADTGMAYATRIYTEVDRIKAAVMGAAGARAQRL